MDNSGLEVAPEDEESPETFEDEDEFTESPEEVLARCELQSGVEPFESLRTRVFSWMAGGTTSDELLELWQGLDSELFSRYHYFQEGLRFQEWTEELVELGRQCFENYSWLQEQMQRLRQGVLDRNSLEVAYAIEQLQSSLLEIHRLYQAFPQDAEGPPSVSPWLSELLRVARLAAAGSLPVESFLERLEAYSELQARARDFLESALPERAEALILEARQAELEEAWQSQFRGLEKLRQFGETFEPNLLEEGLEELERAAEFLTGLGRQLEEAEASRQATACPFCGGSNVLGQKLCGQCSARLPEPPSMVNVAADSAAPAPNFARISACVQAYLKGQSTEAELRQGIEEFASLFGGASRRLGAVGQVPPQAPQEERELFEASQAISREALSRIQAGLELLEGSLQAQQASQRGHQLQQGLEIVLEGGGVLGQLEGVLEQAAELAKAQPTPWRKA